MSAVNLLLNVAYLGRESSVRVVCKVMIED